MTDFRALCAELTHFVERLTAHYYQPVELTLRARAALQEPESSDPWKDTLIDALICSHILEKEHESNPRKALNDLLAWEIVLAKDPILNGLDENTTTESDNA